MRDEINIIDTYKRRTEHKELFSAIEHEIREAFEYRFISYPEDAELIESMIRLTQAKRVLELGMYSGFTTLHMVRGIFPDGLVVSIDCNPAIEPNPIFARDDLKKCFRFVRGRTPEVITSPAMADYRLEDNGFDLVYVDSDHSLAHTESERLALWPITHPGTVFIYHDCPKRTNPDSRETGAVYNYLTGLVQNGVYRGAIFPSPDRIDVKETFGAKYHRDLLPHLGIFIRQ